MRWKTNPLEGWHTSFAIFPVALSSGETVLWEHFRFYVSGQGLITTIIGMPK